MTNSVILTSSLLLALSSYACCWLAEAGQTQHTTTAATTPQPTNTNLDDPTDLTTSTTTTSDSGSEDDTICFRCYDQVQTVQSSLAVYDDLIKKQKKLVKHMTASARKQAQSKSRHQQTIASSKTNQTTPSSSTVRNRTLMNGNLEDDNRAIVVSRLRVARSTLEGESAFEYSHIKSDLHNSRSNSDKGDALEKLKLKIKEQVKNVCKSLREGQQCLSEISRECLGHLQFHSQDVYLKQWFIRLECPPINDPNFKPFPWIARSIPRLDDIEEKVPSPRPISSQEEVRRRIHVMLSGGNSGGSGNGVMIGGSAKPTPNLGVMLKPTLTKSASQKFNSMNLSDQHVDGSAMMTPSRWRGRHRYNENEITDYGRSRQPAESHQLALDTVSPLLIVPCFLLLIIAITTLTLRLYKSKQEQSPHHQSTVSRIV